MGKTVHTFCFVFSRHVCFFTLNCQHADKNSAHAAIDLSSRHKINPRSTRFVSGKASECGWRPRRYVADPWSTGREVARGVLRSSRKPEKKVFLPSESDRDFLSVFYTLLIAAIFCETPGRRPPHITGRRVNTVTLEWVGAPNERALFRFLDAVVGFVDRCLSRTQNLAASN